MVAPVLLAAGAGGGPSTIGLGSLHGAKPGMSQSQIQAALQVPVKVDYPQAFPGCGTADVSLGGRKAVLWFVGRKFARADFDGGARTAKGIAIGSSLAQLRKAYGGALRSKRQPYAAPGVNDYYVQSATRPRIYNYFTMSNGRVKKIMYGDDFVFAEEGCA
jgi:hypothetical protein